MNTLRQKIESRIADLRNKCDEYVNTPHMVAQVSAKIIELQWVLSELDKEQEQAIEMVVNERKRAVRIVQEYRDRAKIIANQNRLSNPDFADTRYTIAIECQFIANTISGLDGLSMASNETIESVIRKEIEQSQSAKQPINKNIG
jgi:predicted nucleic-acid-binding protein